MRYIIILLLSINIYAIEYKLQNSNKRFLKLDKTLRTNNTNDGCYYKNSYIDKSACYKQTRNIFLTYITPINSKTIAKKYNLKKISIINKKKKTYLYKVLNNEVEIIELVNDINQNEKSIKAKVEWISPRVLR
jgi:hypothetical protein